MISLHAAVEGQGGVFSRYLSFFIHPLFTETDQTRLIKTITLINHNNIPFAGMDHRVFRQGQYAAGINLYPGPGIHVRPELQVSIFDRTSHP